MQSMLITDLPIPDYLKSNLLKAGIRELYPPQAEAIKRNVLSGKNLILATPTASGKTLVAILAASIHLAKGGKVMYLTPLRALTSEKLHEFKTLLASGEGGRIKVAATSGDYDSEDRWLADYDVIICTNEKADSLLRHGAEWVRDVSLLIVDEVHVIGEPERGPTLEVVLTRLRDMSPRAQILSLSATIRNAEELADWLGSECVVSEWRPVPLREAVYFEGKLEFNDGDLKLKNYESDPTLNVAIWTVMEGGQALIFALSRRKAESLAEKAAAALSRHPECINYEEAEMLRRFAEDMMSEGDRSSFTERLVGLTVRGSAFHHAGLGYKHRQIIEEAFRSRCLKILCATPTLAAGVNLPARTVIIPELWRYEPTYGMQYISVMEYKQFSGRAGRPRYDDVGYAVSIARKEVEREMIFSRYIMGLPEKIYSRLSSERHIRMQTLALVATRAAESVKELLSFFEKTFFGYQYGVIGVKDKIIRAIDFLDKHNMVEVVEGVLSVTKLGKRVSELYIDPLTAVRLVEAMKAEVRKITTVTLLQMLCMTPDIPSIPMARVSLDKLANYYEKHKEELLIKPPDPEEEPEAYEAYLESLKNVMVLEGWVNEVSEGDMYENFGVEPGDLAALRERAEWVCYSAHQIANVIRATSFISPLRVMTERLRHGVREELIPLARLEGIGRVRARALYSKGFRSVEDLKRASVNDLMSVPGIGPQIARRIKEQLG
ncbi:MAG: DEAD/DEAH box helicase, partial [Nitrososphaerota archaeon]|nr:DEAD/DEAH box helicase [Nitrososphaerota archaeon]